MGMPTISLIPLEKSTKWLQLETGTYPSALGNPGNPGRGRMPCSYPSCSVQHLTVMGFSAKAFAGAGTSNDENVTGTLVPWHCRGCWGPCLCFPVLLFPGKLSVVHLAQDTWEMRQVFTELSRHISHVRQEMLHSMREKTACQTSCLLTNQV